jgi:hypothetical protein
MLGYLHNIKGVPLEQLRLSHLLPSHEREGVAVLMEYQAWRQQQRGTASSTATLAIKAMIHLARFLHHDKAQVGSVCLPSQARALTSLCSRRRLRVPACVVSL